MAGAAPESPSPPPEPADLPPGVAARELAAIRDALRLSTQPLLGDRFQLAGQLLGRLGDLDSPGIAALLARAGRWEGAPWLRPLTASLVAPGGAIALTLTGHVRMINAVAWTSRGRMAVSAAADGTVRVWDLEVGRQLHRLTRHEDYDGRLAYATQHGLGLLDSHLCLAVTPDGRRALSGTWEEILAVWDLERGTLLEELEGHTGGIFAVAIAADGRCAVSGSDDRTLRIWDLAGGAESRVLEGHSDGIRGVALTRDGRCAVSGSLDRTVKVWDLTRGEATRTLGHPAGVLAVCLTPDDRRLLSASWDNTLRLWDLERGEVVRTLTGHGDKIWACALTRQGRAAVYGADDGSVGIWDLERGELESTVQLHSAEVQAFAVTSDGRRLLSGSNDGTLRLSRLEPEARRTGEARASRTSRATHDGPVAGIALTPDGRRAISGSEDRTLRLWDAESGAELGILSGHSGAVTAVATFGDGGRALSASEDGTLRVWDLERLGELQTLTGHEGPVGALAVTPDGRWAVSGSRDNTLRIWDLTSGRATHSISVASTARSGSTWNGGVGAVAVTPDGRRALCCCHDRALHAFDLGRGVQLPRSPFFGAGVPIGRRDDFPRAVALTATPDGRFAISCSPDETVKVWDLERGGEDGGRALYGRGASALAVHPAGRLALAAARDGTLRVRELSDWGVVATFSAERSLRCCAVSRDGRTAVAGDTAGGVHFLRLEAFGGRLGPRPE